jgi:hypothetical protein
VRTRWLDSQEERLDSWEACTRGGGLARSRARGGAARSVGHTHAGGREGGGDSLGWVARQVIDQMVTLGDK